MPGVQKTVLEGKPLLKNLETAEIFKRKVKKLKTLMNAIQTQQVFL